MMSRLPIGLFLLFATAICVWSIRSAKPLPDALSPEDPHYENVICGPTSLSVALARLGIYESQGALAAECRVTALGVSFDDLYRSANGIPSVSAEARDLNWDELSALDGVAVLHVGGNHFIAIDPRESTPDSKNSLRVYRPKRPAQWLTREKLEQSWDGKALVLTKHDTVPEALGPAVEWDTCFQDNGIIQGTTVSRFEFKCWNRGQEELKIGELKTSCGCMAPVVGNERLAPGEFTTISVEVDLTNKEGYVMQNVVVPTNDPVRPVTLLRMSGGVPRTRFVSCKEMRLEDLPQGGTLSQEFYVVDPGFDGIGISKSSFVLSDGTIYDSDVLKCTISDDVIGLDSVHRSSSGGFHVEPDDLAVTMEIKANQSCPPGEFAGDVILVLDAGSDRLTVKVAVSGMIVKDVQSWPKVALLAIDGEGRAQATIQLRSCSDQPIHVVKMWSDCAPALQIRQIGDTSKFELAGQFGDTIAEGPPLREIVFFELEDGTTVEVPVAIVKPPARPL